MLTQEAALKFAQQWINDWNRHDLEAILTHYVEDIEFNSPLIVKIMQIESGSIRDKATLKDYFTKGLAAYPGLKFEPLTTLIGNNSVVLYYRSINNRLSAEFMEINSDGLVSRVVAHYSEGE